MTAFNRYKLSQGESGDRRPGQTPGRFSFLQKTKMLAVNTVGAIL